MRRKPLIVAVIAVVAIGLVVFGVIQVRAQMSEPPSQPIAFSHPVHVKAAQIECLFCHRNADKGANAGIPAIEQCMFCHRVVGQNVPEIDKVRAAWDKQEPVNWNRVHREPDHVHFIHEPHIRAGFDCSTCHGQVQDMVRVRQVRSLKMGDCVDCHRTNNAPTDCGTCHY